MLMGDDSCSKGRGSNPGDEYWMDILFTLICSEKCIVCLKDQK